MFPSYSTIDHTTEPNILYTLMRMTYKVAWTEALSSMSMCEITYTSHYVSVTRQNQTKGPCYYLNIGGF